jgi:dTDP-4-amino-4,6-dideoxygalactose transaminase
MLGYYKEKYQISEDQFPEAKKANNCSMAIPLHNRMVEEDYKYIVELLHKL